MSENSPTSHSEQLNLNQIFSELRRLREHGVSSPLSVALVEPTTLIATIVAVARLLLELFGDDPAADTVIWLKKASGQLGRIERLLEEALRLLNALPDLVRLEFIENDKRDLMSLIHVYEEHAEEWSKSKDRSAVDHLQGHLVAIQRLAGKLMHSSFGAYNHIAYALRIETDLLSLTKSSNSTKCNGFESYSEYFQNCLNPDIPGSITQAKNILVAERNSLKSEFPDSDGREWRVVRETGNDSERSCHWDAHLVCFGSLESGFRTEIRRDTPVCTAHGHAGGGGGGGHGGGGDPAAGSIRAANLSTVLTAEDDVAWYLGELNRATARYQSAVGRIAGLDTAIPLIETFKAKAATLLAGVRDS